MSVRCIVSDGHVWNPEKLVADLMQEAQQKRRVMLDLNREGPCCGTSGINQILDHVVTAADLDPASVVITTCNNILSSHYQESRLGIWQQMKANIDFSNADLGASSINKRFGLFIARSNWKRLGLAAHVWRHHRDISALTYHFDPHSDYHRSNFGLEQYLQENWLDQDIFDFLRVLPLRFQEETYPISWHSGLERLRSQYREIFCDIACETFFTGKTFFVTEKTWRPILYRRPFLVQGPQWFLENLRRLGFRTFSSWWNEGYDEDINGGSLTSLRDTIDFIAQQPQHVIRTWYQEMQPTLDHNRAVLENLTQQDFDRCEFEIPQ